MSAIDKLFDELRGSGRKALMPFVTAGDPDLAFTAAVLRELAKRGASLCELGIPYSDPIADGPVIQASYTRALAKKIRLDQILEMVRGLRAGERMGTGSEPASENAGRNDRREVPVPILSHPQTPTFKPPLVSMVSYAIVYRHGLEKFVADAQAAGLAGAIVPDLPVDEAAPLARICRAADFSLIQLVTPTTPRPRAVRIAETSSGFLYYVSVTGITGERGELPPDLIENVRWIREQTPLPVCIGFGISTPEHVRRLAPVADGLIVGSAVVRRIAAASGNGTPREAVLADVGKYVSELLGALNP